MLKCGEGGVECAAEWLGEGAGVFGGCGCADCGHSGVCVELDGGDEGEGLWG